MARTSTKAAKAQVSKNSKEIESAMKVKGTRTRRIQPRKMIFILINDNTGWTLEEIKEYTTDLAIMHAMRTLTSEKKNGNPLTHATLYLNSEDGKNKVQGFRRA